VLHTPLPMILIMRQGDAIEWYRACDRFQNPKTEH
jgi:hypothetical protein